MWTDEEVWCVLFFSLDFFGKTWLFFRKDVWANNILQECNCRDTITSFFGNWNLTQLWKSLQEHRNTDAGISFIFKVWSILMNQSGICRFVSVVFSYITFSSSPDRLFCCYFADNLPLPKFSSTKWLWVCHVALVFYFIYRICSADRSLSWFKQFSSIFLTWQTNKFYDDVLF